MNICITNIDIRPEYIGGIKRVSSVLACEWRQAGHNVYFMSLCRSELRLSEIAGTPQFFLPDIFNDAGRENTAYFTQFIQERQIDIVLHQHVEEQGMTALCEQIRKTAPVKVIMAYHFAPTHNLDIVDHSFFAQIASGNVLKRYVKDAVMCVRWYLWHRRQVKNDLIHYFSDCLDICDRLILLSDRFIPIMNDLTNNRFQKKIAAINNPAVYRANLILPDKHKTVLWCGRIEYGMKRTDRMLDIWKQMAVRHPDWECLILGSGNIGHFERLIEKQRIENIRLLGFCDPKSYYETGAILCMTSSTEGWGMVMIEAMAHGCVPIAYNSYASLQDIIIDGENGFAISAFDEKAYITKLSKLMSDNSLREIMAEKAKKSVLRFNATKIATGWIKLFDGMTNR